MDSILGSGCLVVLVDRRDRSVWPAVHGAQRRFSGARCAGRASRRARGGGRAHDAGRRAGRARRLRGVAPRGRGPGGRYPRTGGVGRGDRASRPRRSGRSGPRWAPSGRAAIPDGHAAPLGGTARGARTLRRDRFPVPGTDSAADIVANARGRQLASWLRQSDPATLADGASVAAWTRRAFGPAVP